MHLYSAYVSSERSGESAHMHRLYAQTRLNHCSSVKRIVPKFPALLVCIPANLKK